MPGPPLGGHKRVPEGRGRGLMAAAAAPPGLWRAASAAILCSATPGGLFPRRGGGTATITGGRLGQWELCGPPAPAMRSLLAPGGGPGAWLGRARGESCRGTFSSQWGRAARAAQPMGARQVRRGLAGLEALPPPPAGLPLAPCPAVGPVPPPGQCAGTAGGAGPAPRPWQPAGGRSVRPSRAHSVKNLVSLRQRNKIQ